ncbi:MAG: hypothetical protein AAFO77_00535 [Pseudomonadota bacterium]
MRNEAMAAAIDQHIEAVAAQIEAFNVSRFIVVGTQGSRPFVIGDREDVGPYVRSMLAEGFYCKTVVQRAWLKTNMIIAIWEYGNAEPDLSGVPNGTLVWRGVDA